MRGCRERELRGVVAGVGFEGNMRGESFREQLKSVARCSVPRLMPRPREVFRSRAEARLSLTHADYI